MLKICAKEFLKFPSKHLELNTFPTKLSVAPNFCLQTESVVSHGCLKRPRSYQSFYFFAFWQVFFAVCVWNFQVRQMKYFHLVYLCISITWGASAPCRELSCLEPSAPVTTQQVMSISLLVGSEDDVLVDTKCTTKRSNHPFFGKGYRIHQYISNYKFLSFGMEDDIFWIATGWILTWPTGWWKSSYWVISSDFRKIQEGY